MKKLIVNADDFGISEGINAGIIECFRNGIVRSTSLMSNIPGFEKSVQLLKKEPDLSVGLHLNITCGSSLSSPREISSLLDKNNTFYSLSRFMSRLFLGRISLREVEKEFSAQIERVIESGINLEHIDSHRHIHFHPAIGRVLLGLSSRFGIRRIRSVSLGLWRGSFYKKQILFRKGIYIGFVKQLILSKIASPLQRPMSNLNNAGHVFGVGYVPKGYYKEALYHYIKNIPQGVSEIVCHPGYVDNDLKEYDFWTDMREEELRAITAKETLDVVRKFNVTLI